MLADVVFCKNLTYLLAGFGVSGVPEVAVSDVVQDSRQVTPGALFLACAGTYGHGLDYAPAAVAAGAAAVAWEPVAGNRAELDVPNIAVPALSARVGDIAARFYDAPSDRLFVAGVTGTDGKTSCAWLVARALSALNARCGYLGTLGYGDLDDLIEPSHTTPVAAGLQRWLARMVESNYQAAALEVSSHALAQYRTDAVVFDVAVLTQIGRDHLDYHGDAAAYVAAKRRLFDRPGLRFVVLNADDATGREWLAGANAVPKPIAYGRADDVASCACFVRIREATAQRRGLLLKVDTHLGPARLESRLIGTFNAYNLAATLAVLLARDAPLAEAVEVLSRLPAVPGRMECVAEADGGPLVIVDYAHTPGALEAALGALAEHRTGRLLCVFGCGGERDRGKRALMGAAVAARADRFWITDDNPRHEDPRAIVADVIEGIPDAVTAGARYEIVHAREAAIRRAITQAGATDIVLIAGKGDETTQQYGNTLISFSDRAVAHRVLEAA